MLYNWNKFAIFSALGAVGSLAVWIGSSAAKEESSVLVKKPAATATDVGPILPPPANPNERGANSAQTPPQSGDFFVPAPAKSGNVPQAEQLPTPPQSTTPPQLSAPANASPTAKRPFMRPAQPREPAKGKLVVGQESIPNPQGAAPIVGAPVESVPPAAGVTQEGIRIQPTPPIEYDTDHDARKMYRTGSVDVLMLTTDPANGCAYEIPMCIPACCVGEPKVKGGRGVLGRGKVEYCWPCGFRAIVKFRHVLGDVKVEYEGD